MAWTLKALPTPAALFLHRETFYGPKRRGGGFVDRQGMHLNMFNSTALSEMINSIQRGFPGELLLAAGTSWFSWFRCKSWTRVTSGPSFRL